MAMEIAQYSITKENIDAFLNGIEKHQSENIYLTGEFHNEWLFIYVFKNYNLNIGEISFRGGLIEKTKRYISKYARTIQKYFPAIETPNISQFIDELLNANEHRNLQCYWKEIKTFLDSAKGKQKFNKNHKFISDIFRAFQITWFLEESEYNRLKEDLQNWVLPELDEYYLHIRKRNDLLLDEDIALKFNYRKDSHQEEDQYKNCYILHKQIWEDFFLEKEYIKPTSAQVIEHLYHISFSSQSRYYKDIAKRIDKNEGSIENAITQIRKACQKLNCIDIVIDSGDGNKMINPNLTHSKRKITEERKKFVSL